MNDVIEIQPGLFWIGETVADLAIKNAYFLKEGETGVLFDPGFFHISIFDKALRQWPSVTLKYIVYPTVNFEHYPLIWELSQSDFASQAKIVVHEIHKKFLSPLKLEKKLLFVNEDYVSIGKCRIKFIPVEVLNFPGTIFTYLDKYKTLLTGPIFSSLYEKKVNDIFANNSQYFGFVDSFHRGYHITSRYLTKPIELVRELNPEIIGPSTGLLYRGKMINGLLEFLAKNVYVEESIYEELADRVLEIITTSLNIWDAFPHIRDVLTKSTTIRDLSILTLGNSMTLALGNKRKRIRIPRPHVDINFVKFVEDAVNKNSIFEFDYPDVSRYLRKGRLYFLPLKIQHGPKSILVFSVEGVLDEDLKRFLYKILPAISATVDRENIYEKLKHEIERYKDQIWTDNLTGLYNKNYLLKEAGKIFGSYERYKNHFSVVMFDIDDFKKINDTYGHLVGDVVLEDLGDIFRRYSRKTDITIRFGGEEFLVILTHTNSRGAYTFAEKIRTIVKKKTFRTKDSEFKVTVSAGVVGTDVLSEIKDFDEILKYADMALYEAKRRGKDRTMIYGK